MGRDGKYGVYNVDFKEWDGMIGDLFFNRVDMVFLVLIIMRMREKYIDFFYLFFYGEMKLFIFVILVRVNVEIGFLVLFDKVLWIVFLVIVSGVFVIVWFMERISLNC